MPGAEARDLGSEGALHVSVAGWVVGAGRYMLGGGRAGAWVGAWPKEIGHLVAHDRARIRPASSGPLALGEPWRAGRRDDCLCFMKNVKFARSPLVTVCSRLNYQPPQLSSRSSLI